MRQNEDNAKWLANIYAIVIPNLLRSDSREIEGLRLLHLLHHPAAHIAYSPRSVVCVVKSLHLLASWDEHQDWVSLEIVSLQQGQFASSLHLRNFDNSFELGCELRPLWSHIMAVATPLGVQI